MKKVTFDEQVKNFFEDDKGQKVKQHLVEILPIYFSERSPKIKPIHMDCPHYYELKIKKGKNHYRMACQLQETIHCIYISESLQKKKFDREVANFLAKNV